MGTGLEPKGEVANYIEQNMQTTYPKEPTIRGSCDRRKEMHNMDWTDVPSSV